jgi:PucR C-terminal helix-turn-helix domain
MNKSPHQLRGPWRELGPDVAEALRPALPGLANEIVEAVRTSVPAYAGSLTGSYGRNIRLGVEQALRGFLELMQEGDRAQLPGREVYEALGAGELREGRTLDALLAAYRAGAQAAWRGLALAGQAADLDPAVMFRLAEAVFAYIDELSAVSAEGFAREQLNRAGELDARRARLLELLLLEPPATGAALDQAAAAADWAMPPIVAALVIERQSRRLEAALPPGSLIVTRGGRRVALLVDPEVPGLRGLLQRTARASRTAAALGPAGAAAEIGRSVRWAEGVLDLELARVRGGGLLLAEEHLLELLLRSNPELLEVLTRRRLAPLDTQTPASRARLVKTLAAWLENHGDAGATAQALGVHVQTVRYRVGRLRELLGQALEEGQGRLELAIALRWAADAAPK